MRFAAGIRLVGFALMGGLYCLMAGQPVVARVRGEKAGRQIEGQERVLHALNRFTFGPRPGEAAAVETMGLRQWFERQLNPRSIDDSALDARLAMFPAMKLPQTVLMERYPTPQRLRQMMRTGEPLPADSVEHAIYANDIARYEAAKVKREAAQAMGAAADAAKMQEPALSGSDVQGAPDGDAVRVIQLPPEERMQRMLQMPPEEFLALRKSLTPKDVAAVQEGLSPEQKELFVALQGGPQVVDSELLQSRMIRDIYSERQLEAVMTDFWLNHFNVYLRKNQNEPYLLPAFERDVIRPNALGKFEDLLAATAKSPAMLVYLDNWQSVGPDSVAAKNAARAAQRAKNPQGKQGLKDRGLNENYGRELMELHTIGVQCEVSADRPARKLDKACGKGYTQQDVIEVAKALTGWTIDRPDNGAAYRFDERRHEPGTKMVMGVSIREGGEAEGMQVLHMLATSPATAKLVSTQVAVRFVSDTPPPALVDRMAKAFVKSRGDIKTVLRTMFNSPEFWSEGVYRSKVKTPIEFVVSAARASRVEVTNAQPLVASLNRLGMSLYGMQTPNGYSWRADPWVNAGDLVNRMNFALVLSGDRMNGVVADWRKLLDEPNMGVQTSLFVDDGVNTSATAKERALEMLLLGQAASDHTRHTVLQQFQSASVQADAAKKLSVAARRPESIARALNVGSPVRQAKVTEDREAEAVAGLLLGSPEFQRR